MCTGKGDTYVNPVLKYLMFSFNFIFWLVGCVAIGVGSYAYHEKQLFSGTNKEVSSAFDLLFDIAILFIVFGIVIFLLSFAGCLGALRENVILLKVFAIALGIIFLLEAIAAVLLFVFSSQAKASITEVLQEQAVVRYRDDLDLQNLIDWFQKTFQCCGVGDAGPKDWSMNPYFNCTDTNPSRERCGVPYSCCITNPEINIINTMCGYDMQKVATAVQSKTIHTSGCVPAVLNWLEANIYVIAGIAIAVAALQLVGVFLAWLLATQVKEQESRLLGSSANTI